MKAWIIPAVALSLLLASPGAIAAPSTENGPTRQDHQKTQGPNAGRSMGDRKADVTRREKTITINRPVEVKRNVIVKRPVVVHGNVRVNRNIDLRVYRRNFYSPRRYHWNVYRRPAGWYHHRWVYGEHLPRSWFAHDYWISSFVMFGLLAPPDGYVWVRVGDDALLVDVDTGEVIRVAYNVFY